MRANGAGRRGARNLLLNANTVVQNRVLRNSRLPSSCGSAATFIKLSSRAKKPLFMPVRARCVALHGAQPPHRTKISRKLKRDP